MGNERDRELEELEISRESKVCFFVCSILMAEEWEIVSYI